MSPITRLSGQEYLRGLVQISASKRWYGDFSPSHPYWMSRRAYFVVLTTLCPGGPDSLDPAVWDAWLLANPDMIWDTASETFRVPAPAAGRGE